MTAESGSGNELNFLLLESNPYNQTLSIESLTLLDILKQ